MQYLLITFLIAYLWNEAYHRWYRRQVYRKMRKTILRYAEETKNERPNHYLDLSNPSKPPASNQYPLDAHF